MPVQLVPGEETLPELEMGVFLLSSYGKEKKDRQRESPLESLHIRALILTLRAHLVTPSKSNYLPWSHLQILLCKIRASIFEWGMVEDTAVTIQCTAITHLSGSRDSKGTCELRH